MQTKDIILGLLIFKVFEMQKVCEACQLGKQARGLFLHKRNVGNDVLEIVHSNVWGPTKTTSMGRCRFYVIFIDDYTRKL